MKLATRTLSAAVLLLAAGTAHAQVQLQPKTTEGKSTSTSQIKVAQVLKVAGNDVPTNVEVTIVTLTDTGKPGADGTLRIASKTDKMNVKLAAPGLDLTFDSAKPDEAKSGIPLVQSMIDAWKALAGSTYTMVVNAKGEVTAVEGVDKIIEKAPQEAAEFLKRDLSFEKIKREAAQELGSLPDKAVNKGDRWQRTEVQDIGAGQTLTLDTFYEYAGTVEKEGKTLDKVTIYVNGVKYAQDPNLAGPAKITNSDLQIAGSSGHYLFDRNTGMVVERATNTRITGTVTLDVNGMELPSTLDLTFDVNTQTRR